MTTQNTVNKITNWAASSTPSVSDWYRTTLGRDGDAGGIAFWEQQLTNGADAQSLYSEFQKAANVNKEVIKAPSSWEAANSYKGPTSSNSASVIDDWGRNVLDRDLTASEQATWESKASNIKTAAESEALYADFLASNAGKVKNNLSLAGASQISGARDLTKNPYTIGKGELSTRNIDKNTETVQGQLASLLAEDSKVLQQARADGMRMGFERGLGNSTMAASAGEDALIRAATGIATTDSGYYNKASDYNVAAENQLLMWNAEQINEFRRLEKQLGSDEAARQMQLKIASMQNDTTKAGQQNQLDIANMQNDTTKAGQAQQLTISQMQDQTSRWQTEQNTANSRYNTDLNYKKDVDNQKLGMANNVIQNMEMSPDRKAAMLEQLGYGTSAKRNPDGSITPGTGMAGAVFVLDSVGAELGGNPSTPTPSPGSGRPPHSDEGSVQY